MPSEFRRVFSSSVGTKLLIGLTGVALVRLHGPAPGRQRPDLPRPRTFNEYSHKLISNPLIIPIEIGLLLVFLLHIYKAITMWMDNQRGPAGALRQEGAGRAHQPQERRVVDDDRVGPVPAGLRDHPRQAVQVRHCYLAAGSDTVRDLYRTEIEVFQQPFWVVVLRRRDAARRPAPAPRDLERVPVAGPRSPALHAAALGDRHRLRGS